MDFVKASKYGASRQDLNEDDLEGMRHTRPNLVK
jgi:hypothetical protein